MELNFYTLCVIYLAYSFLGWAGETVVATAKGKSFVNRGVASGPFCFIYGFTAVLITVGFADLRAEPVFLFLGCTVDATIVEWLTAKLLERMHRRRWWDYSQKKFNLDGYVCLQYSLLWGALGTVCVLWGNDLLFALYRLIPGWLARPVLWAILVLALLDQLASALIVRRGAVHPRLEQFSVGLAQRTARLSQRIATHVEARIQRAYPEAAKPQSRAEAGVKPIAIGDLLWLFVIGAFVGDVVETLFCRMTAGVWMSRSSLVWGPFSIVWGGGFVLATILLRQGPGKERTDRAIFTFGFVMGGAYEYVCSAVGELMFGVVFWDYSGFMFNLGGRINLLYCFFWGVAAVVWMRYGYPLVEKLRAKVHSHIRPWMTALLAVFMAANMLVSTLALIRYDERGDDISPQNEVDILLDEHFGDERMERIYPNAKKVE